MDERKKRTHMKMKMRTCHIFDATTSTQELHSSRINRAVPAGKGPSSQRLGRLTATGPRNGLCGTKTDENRFSVSARNGKSKFLSNQTCQSPARKQNPISISSLTVGVLTLIAIAAVFGQPAVTQAQTIPRVATPTFSPGPGTYTRAQNVTIFTTMKAATIRYTVNGSDPTSSSPLYRGPVTISTTTVLKARAFARGMTDSAVASGTYTINLPRVATPTFSPGPGTYSRAQNVTIATATPGATIRYTLDNSVPPSSWTLYSGPVRISSTVDLWARAFASGMTDSAVASGTYNIPPRVVLLLHGVGGDPGGWSDFLLDSTYFDFNWQNPLSFPVAPVIYGGVVQGGQWPTLDLNGVLYYRVKFGAFDQNPGRTGLENLRSTSPQGDSGDFTSFSGANSLAQEVKDAITCILSRHANAQILLVGHSRGGIAGRAFLQTTSYTTERSAVVGLLTIGTPHQGSPLGRVYEYLANNPRGPILMLESDDWKLADFLRDHGEDVRRPTTDDFAPESSPLNLLAQGTINLPVAIKYGTLTFDGTRFGLLKQEWYGALDIFTGGCFVWIICYPRMTDAAIDAVCKGMPRETFHGDGVVPLPSQTFSGNGITVTQFSNTDGVLHTEETTRKLDIRRAMKRLVNWWD